MKISNRTKISIGEILELLNENTKSSLLEKHNISYKDEYDEFMPIRQAVVQAESIASLFGEIVRRRNDIRYDVMPKYRFDERWRELEKCLLLDGYKIEYTDIYKYSGISLQAWVTCKALICMAPYADFLLWEYLVLNLLLKQIAILKMI